MCALSEEPYVKVFTDYGYYLRNISSFVPSFVTEIRRARAIETVEVLQLGGFDLDEELATNDKIGSLLDLEVLINYGDTCVFDSQPSFAWLWLFHQVSDLLPNYQAYPQGLWRILFLAFWSWQHWPEHESFALLRRVVRSYSVTDRKCAFFDFLTSMQIWLRDLNPRKVGKKFMESSCRVLDLVLTEVGSLNFTNEGFTSPDYSLLSKGHFTPITLCLEQHKSFLWFRNALFATGIKLESFLEDELETQQKFTDGRKWSEGGLRALLSLESKVVELLWTYPIRCPRCHKNDLFCPRHRWSEYMSKLRKGYDTGAPLSKVELSWNEEDDERSRYCREKELCWSCAYSEPKDAEDDDSQDEDWSPFQLFD